MKERLYVIRAEYAGEAEYYRRAYRFRVLAEIDARKLNAITRVIRHIVVEYRADMFPPVELVRDEHGTNHR